jgi:hypothetical protein
MKWPRRGVRLAAAVAVSAPAVAAAMYALSAGSEPASG